MDRTEAQAILDFIQQAEKLKDTPRFAFTSTGKHESAAEHSWRLCLLLLVCARFYPGANLEKCLKMAVIHDLAEALCGDTPAIYTEQHEQKAGVERSALAELLQSLPESIRREITGLWEEYESAATDEAIFVKALDKLETLIQHNQGQNPPGIDYNFNLTYGPITEKIACTAQLRELVDARTRARRDGENDAAG